MLTYAASISDILLSSCWQIASVHSEFVSTTTHMDAMTKRHLCVCHCNSSALRHGKGGAASSIALGRLKPVISGSALQALLMQALYS